MYSVDKHRDGMGFESSRSAIAARTQTVIGTGLGAVPVNLTQIGTESKMKLSLGNRDGQFVRSTAAVLLIPALFLTCPGALNAADRRDKQVQRRPVDSAKEAREAEERRQVMRNSRLPQRSNGPLPKPPPLRTDIDLNDPNAVAEAEVLSELGTEVQEPQIPLPEYGSNVFRLISKTHRKPSRDKLVELTMEAVETTERRLLSTNQHTPWQILHALLGLRMEFNILHEGKPVSGLDWVAEGQKFDGDHWFEVTEHGGRAHPYSRPYAFEGHANQTLAILSMCGLELDHEFGTSDRPITIRQMVRHAQMTVSTKDEPTWTLWSLSRYLPPDAAWTNAEGERWSIERLVKEQTDKPMQGSACGGTHGLFALAHARNVYLRKEKRLRGVWLQAEYKIRQHINAARMQQNANGSLSSNYFRGREYNPDFNKRMSSVGHVLEFLMIALPQKELNERWVRRAIESAARDLLDNKRAYVKCSPLYHTVNALNIYLDRVNPRVPNDKVAEGPSDKKTASLSTPKDSNNLLRPVPIKSASRDRVIEEADDAIEDKTQQNPLLDIPESGLILPPVERAQGDTPDEHVIIPEESQDEIDAVIGTDTYVEASEDGAVEKSESESPATEGPFRDRKVETGETDEKPVVAVKGDRWTATDPSRVGLPVTGNNDPTESVTEEIIDEQIFAQPAPTTVLASREREVPPAKFLESDTVPAGVNRSFLDPKLDPREWVNRFENEKREIFAARGEILKALNLKPGMSVADVGAGTGLFVKGLAQSVGPDGRVYAIDISPRLVEFLDRRIAAEDLANVAVVRNTNTSLVLGHHKVDRILICDTYHHFDEHKEMLSDIYEHLNPGGEVVLVDYERIPGESREWVLNHVRGGKMRFRGEFVDAGFQFLEEVEIEGFAENYVLRFRRPKESTFDLFVGEE